MKYHGTIKGKERELGNLRRLLTQNKDDFFNNGYFSYQDYMCRLYFSEGFARSISGRKASVYLKKIFKGERDLLKNFHLLIPDEKDILINKLFDKNELYFLFRDSLEFALYTQFIVRNFEYIYYFFEGLLMKLFEYKIKESDEKLKLIRNYLFKNDKYIILNSKDNIDFIKQVFENGLDDELINPLLIYLKGYNDYNKEKYTVLFDKDQIKLKNINFSLTKKNGFKELNFVLNFPQIGIVKFDLNKIKK